MVAAGGYTSCGYLAGKFQEASHRHTLTQAQSPGFSSFIEFLLFLTCPLFLSFLTWTIFKVFFKFVSILLLFFVFFFFFFLSPEACGILAPQSRIKPTPPALEGEVLTSVSPGKSLSLLFLSTSCLQDLL